jgi:hypothetical protein
MAVYKTKYFGDFTVDETSETGQYEMVFKEQKMRVTLKDAAVGSGLLCGDNLKEGFEFLDKYAELDEAARRYMLEDFSKNGQIYDYFEHQFDDYMRDKDLIAAFGTTNIEDLDIQKAVGQMKYPNVQFLIYDELNIILNYGASTNSSLLSIQMDKNLTITRIVYF